MTSSLVTRVRHAPPTGSPPGPAPRRRRPLAPWLLLTPAGLVLIAVSVLPIAFLVWASFTDYDQRTLFTGAYRIVGVSQYSALFGSAEFWRSLGRTAAFTAAMVLGSVVIGTGAAHLLTKLGSGMRTLTSLVLVCAWAMPTVASSLVWKWLFQPGYGVVNWLLTQTRLFGDMTSTDWSNNAWLAYLSIGMLVVWQAVPFIALTLYAALTQLPAELDEAARLDGAGEWRVWWSITLPMLRPTLLLVTLMSVIWDFNIFNQIWLISSGGPDDATTTLGIFSYKTAFVNFHIGQGAALSVVTTIVLLGLTALYIRNLLRSGEDL